MDICNVCKLTIIIFHYKTKYPVSALSGYFLFHKFGRRLQRLINEPVKICFCFGFAAISGGE